ncbi:MAG TPA: ferric aerobactin receptor [Flavobacteriales bacterium]|jgi:hypothetical protein|nr:ferric aerobactin receptor [Flavobacteriales bacterium]
MRYSLIISVFLLSFLSSYSQTGSVFGVVTDQSTNQPVPFANVVIQGTSLGSTTDIDGKYEITTIDPGEYNIEVRYVGYNPVIISEIIVSNVRKTEVNIELVPAATKLDEVVVQASPFTKSDESPVSLSTISAAEIYRNPGSNRDISRVIQNLPGVSTTVSFRNDIIVRGGAPNENRFFLDGIEVPNINHFATQGSSGGPVGMINVNFIREVDFYSSAFPSTRGNALSSVMEFKQIEGNREKLTGTFMLGSSDVGLTLNGPIGNKSSFVFSVRRSYLQFLFSALRLPFLPTYNDAQLKYTYRIDEKNIINVIGLGAIDDFELNTSVNDGETDEDIIERNTFILDNIPVNNQWNYAIGINYKHIGKNGFQTFVVSRNHLDNSAIKYRYNIETPDNLLLDYESQEIENKFRFENNQTAGKWKYTYGAGYEYATYLNRTFQQRVVDETPVLVNFNSELNINKFALFGNVSRKFADELLTLSFGIRTDFNDLNDEMIDPISQLSPRLSASYKVAPRWTINANVGRYFQLPPYTVMGFRDNNGSLVNADNGLSYIESDHFVAGFKFFPTEYSLISVEAFYKLYNDYPLLTTDSLSLANLGGDFGVIGNEPAVSTSRGRSYGIEILAQQKLSSSIYGIVALTLVASEFTDRNDEFVASAWDNRIILNITAGKKFKNNWEVGANFRLQGGGPYTPFDVPRSSLIEVWDVNQQGVLDFNQLNTLRLGIVHALDVRVDKKWFFKKWALNIYLDIENVYNFQAQAPPFLNVRRDDQGLPLVDPNDPARYQTYLIEDFAGTLLPSIGVMIDF